MSDTTRDGDLPFPDDFAEPKPSKPVEPVHGAKAASSSSEHVEIADGRRPGYGRYSGYRAAYGPIADDVHLLEYVRVLYKRRWAAITAFVIIFLTVTIYTLTATPIYEGRAQLLIEPENPNVVSFKEVLEQDRATTEYYQTQYRILRSRALARRTIQAEKLWRYPEFVGTDKKGFSFSGLILSAFTSLGRSFSYGNIKTTDSKSAADGSDETAAQSNAIDSFLSRLTVSPVRNSRLVDIAFESPDPSFAARVANALAEQYIQQNLEFRFLTTKEASEFLGERLAEQRKKVEASELALQRYREQGDAVALDDRQNIVVQRLADLNAALTKVRTARIEKEALHRQLQSMQAERAALDSFPAILSNAFIQQLKAQLVQLQQHHAQLGERLGPKHPEIVKVQSAIESTDAKLRSEVGKVVQSVRNEYMAAASQEQSLGADLERQKADALALNRKGIEYGVLLREAESNRQIYQSLLQRAKETSVSGELKTSNIRVVDSAELPRSAARPARRLNVLMAVVGGAILGVCLAFFFEYLDNRIKSPEQIKTQLGLPFLGIVPALSMKSRNGTDPLLNNALPQGFDEAFRSVRSNVLFSSAAEGGKSLLVTSTAPGEGKTLMAANLAISLAQAGQRVALLDCDMRKPRLHEIFKVPQEPGLSNLLVGQSKASQTLRRTGVSNLWIASSGVPPPNPAELLGSKRFADFLSSLEGYFDWTVMDSPPVLAVTDAAVLAHLATAVTFVVGNEMTSSDAAQAAVEQLDKAKGRLIGAVLNRVNLDASGYYYSRYYRKDYMDSYQRSRSATTT